MAGQQNLLNFLNNGPTPTGKATPTVVMPAPSGSKPTPPQKAYAQQVKQAQAAADQRERELEQADQQQQKAITLGVTQAGERLNTIGRGIESWAERIPTPGGIGVLLLAIFFLLWAVVPVNGKHTRLELLWLTFTGRTSMASAPEGGVDTGSSSGTGVGDYSANGHTSATADILSNLPILDFEAF